MDTKIKMAIAEFNAMTVQQIANLDLVSRIGRDSKTLSPLMEMAKKDFGKVDAAEYRGGYMATYYEQWDRANLEDDFVPKMAILQLREGEEQHMRRFESVAGLERMGEIPHASNYEVVYVEDGVAPALDETYARFNSGKRPVDYYGHSLSVSDVIVSFTNTVEAESHFVDSVGFAKLPADFLPKEVSDKIRLGMDVKTEFELHSAIRRFAEKYDLRNMKTACLNNPRMREIERNYARIFENVKAISQRRSPHKNWHDGLGR